MNPLSIVDTVATRVATGAGDAVAFAKRAEVTGRNTAEYIRYGGLRVDEESSPYQVVATGAMYKLRRYFPDEIPADLPALVLVPPLMMTADIYDVAPRSSSVRAVHDSGIDVWVVDFGRPEVEPGGLQRTVVDHVLAVSDAVDEIRRHTGRDVVLGGYSQGGQFCYQATAYRRGAGIDSIVTFGSPIDWRAAPLPIPISADSFVHVARGILSSGLLEHVSLPPWFNKTWTRLIDPIKTAEFKLQYYRQLGDRDRLLPGEQQRQYLENGGWTAWAGPALAELMELTVTQNRLLDGGLVYGDRTVTLADIDCPIMITVGTADREGPPESARAIVRAAPRADVYELTLHTGHFGLVAGAGARKRTWPRVADWIRWRAGVGERPEVILPAAEVAPSTGWTPGTTAQRLQAVVDLSVGVSSTAVAAVTDAVELAQTVVRERGAQVPLLNRLDALQPATAISLGLLLDEAARRDPDGIALLFGDRVVRHRELEHRVDSVVKGLIGIGVRQGDRVGVLMDSRPSALSVVAAISRLGAVAVLLRPDGDLTVESRLGEISCVISDPEHAQGDAALPNVTWCVLGGGTQPRSLPPHVTDLEQIDPDRVPVPAWFRPNPRHGADLAFVLFSGEGNRTRARFITNRRWALSALATASAAALKPADTVYSVTPLHHSSALLMAVGGAIAAGSRLALASGTDADTFWAEVRRYGATHVSYTWASLREIADGPVHPNEPHHPIKLFFGSGMPANLWQRVNERFAPARVLEFYASADGEAILANVAGTKVGSVGRPLPGTTELKIAAYDPARRRLAFDARGMARECRVGETGVLLAQFDPDTPAQRRILRGVFTPDDAWQATGDLFNRDADGDYWLVAGADSLIDTATRPVAPSRVRNTLGNISCVDLAVAYGIPNGDHEVVGAAVTLLDGAELRAWDLDTAVRRLDPAQRPHTIYVVSDVPLTTTSRPLLQHLRDAGLQQPDTAEAVWRLRSDGKTYERIH